MSNQKLNYLFVTGLGRSGTTFLANLLSGVPRITSDHERIGDREYWLLSWYLGGNYSVPYLQREKSVIDSKFSEKTLYVDVNSYLQNSVPQVREVFGSSSVLHLVRDPKEVIRSIYTRRNDNDIHLLPKDESQIRNWLEKDRFYQVCLNWKLAIEQMVEHNVEPVKFEELTTNYQYISEKLLKPYNISLSEGEWQQAKAKKANKTPSKPYRYVYAKLKGKQFQKDELGKFDSWTVEYQNIYNDVCAELAEKLGY